MSITYTTWNPEDKAANVILSNGNLTVTCPATWDSVRSIASRTTGKCYFEITINKYDHIMSGVATSDANLTSYLGSDIYGLGWMAAGSFYVGSIFTANGKACLALTNGDVVCIALDLDAGKLWFGKNGVWIGSGDPVAGTDWTFSFTGGLELFAACSVQSGGGTANFGASSFSHTVPNGFNSGLYIGSLVAFTFTNPIPEHLSTVYGETEQLQLTTTISGGEESYTYDADFYDGFGVQIGTTISGISSGSSAISNSNFPTPSGVDYNWYVVATSSGSEDTSVTYTFYNRFLYEGYVTENSGPVSRTVRLYYRDTGELIDSTTSSGSNGYYSLDALVNDEHFIVAFDDEVGEDYNALILDRVLPNGEE